MDIHKWDQHDNIEGHGGVAPSSLSAHWRGFVEIQQLHLDLFLLGKASSAGNVQCMTT
jgi:hypothetical protein